MSYYVVISIGSILALLGASAYAFIAYKHRMLLSGQPQRQQFVNIVSHLPIAEAGPGPHIFAGTFLVAGLALLIAAILSDALASRADFVAVAVSTASLVIGVVFSTVALWTLWQARRLEFQAGYKIHDFHALIEQLNKDLESLIYSFQTTYQFRAQPFHRVYFVTTHPFFGQLSYSTSEETRAFANHLRALSQFRAESIEKRAAGEAKFSLEFHVLCGDDDAIARFVKAFYTGGDVDEDSMAKQVSYAKDEIDRLNGMVSNVGGLGPFHRVKNIPPVQFMVIGNKLYEFTLDGENTETEVFNTQVVYDSRFCQKYVETFEILAGGDKIYVDFDSMARRHDKHRPQIDGASSVVEGAQEDIKNG